MRPPEDERDRELVRLQRRIAELELADQKRQQVQDALRESEARLQAAIESLPFDFFALNTDGRYIMQNSVCAENWGPLKGKHPRELDVDQENLDLWLDNNRRALAGETVKGEVELVVKGQRKYFYNIIAPIRVDGQIHGILGINVDISDRKRAEQALQRAHDDLENQVRERTADLTAVNEQLRRQIEERRQVERALRESQANMRALMDATTESIILVDTEGTILDINEYGARRLGGNPEKLIGKCGWNLVSPEPLAGRAAHIQKVIRTGKPASFRDERDGNIYDASLYPVLDHEGRAHRIAVFARDMTESVRAEQAIREREEQFRVLTEQSMLAVLIIQDERIRLTNQTAADMLERSIGEIQDITLEELANFVHPDDREDALDQVRRAATADTGVDERFRLRILNKSGQTRWVESFQRSIRLKARPAVLVTGADISDQVAAEESLKYLNQKLREEQDALEQKNIALRQTMLAVQEEKSKVTAQIQANVNRMLMPLVSDLERQLPSRFRGTIELLRTSLKEIAEPIGSELERKLVDLTPREVEICRMIRNGMITKEIADFLHLAESTIEKYRHNIRKKLDLTGKNTNLRTHLLSL